MLTKLLDTKDQSPEKYTDWHVIMGAFTNIVAGADTSWVSLNGILYHLIKNPESLQKLRKEIDDMSSKGALSNPAKFSETQRMPYLQAVVKEGLRVYPATGFPLWRTVPEPGATLCGNFFLPGVSSTSVLNVQWCTIHKLIRLLT
jgi:cytochrome P450